MAISSGHLNWTPLAGEGIGRPAAGRNNLSLPRPSITGEDPGRHRNNSEELDRPLLTRRDRVTAAGAVRERREYPVQRVDATERPGDDVDVG